ncbi:MAG: tryptophan 7-halogenase [Dokdonella sp.]|uniref:NAD(P)/FAD-dependent oxidoreductase n=1 Tax=Dokdonella sp. TaxID=2291710 RepID=UPI002C9BB044|nr:tryptophan 7-halogenase [Xanthomonadales bacterium]HQV72946.1 tryptophan 7-halogenase [Dokdonella sp.]MBK7210486.1 tryptophan 7-halogenase [Xanthomonadales bacterium]MBL0223939.1 tryptophan 7-halogenase [Xanthomonadales bacterium]HQW76101.1 tryptophan 7-halogenase [Dokdonella sp.]
MSENLKADVVILGGGLAGLCLALQLRQRFADLAIVVLERNAHPLPVAAHKVGESKVEIGAHYLADTLGLRPHLDTAHIRKFGFRFFWSEGREDLEGITELGVSSVMPTPTWQIDRGILENHLGELARERGIDFRDESIVRAIDLAEGNAAHVVRATVHGAEMTCSARWVVDASGRAGLIKRKLDLAEDNGHDCNAVWFRIDDRLAVDDWCADQDWRERCEPRQERWRSTNHLCGPGYWVWLIPLGSGAHSVGIVCDATMHPLEKMKSFDRALEWLREHQPLVAKACEAKRDKLMDFRFLRSFSYGCKQVFSGDRWALTGEAGVFLDPFYSPGSDFIAISNTYVCELIALDLAGKPLGPYARMFEQLYFSFYRNTLSLYQNNYALFGDAEVMSIKVIWDYTYYWGVLCPLVFQNRLTDIALLGEVQNDFIEASRLNLDMQAFFRRWAQARIADNRPLMLDQQELGWFVAMNASLRDELSTAEVRERLHGNVGLLRDLSATIVARAHIACPSLDAAGLPSTAAAATPLFAEVA